jgi:demethylmenaquinone methyltransferase / 2-methoxy-6-polyprenyl-1,4-benzoquinol methylase
MQDAGFVKEAFAGIARRYVLTNHVLSMGTDILWRMKTARLVASLKPRIILDLATGSGDLATAISRRCQDARVLGMDFSVPMMREAQRQNFQSLIAADALALPLSNQCVDVVTVAFGLRNMASWPRALTEMHRVLRPGGHLIILDFSLPSPQFLRTPYLFYLKRVMPRIAGLLTGKRDAYDYLCGSIEKFPSGEQMESLLRECDFDEAVTRPLSGGIASLYSATRK